MYRLLQKKFENINKRLAKLVVWESRLAAYENCKDKDPEKGITVEQQKSLTDKPFLERVLQEQESLLKQFSVMGIQANSEKDDEEKVQSVNPIATIVDLP
eukprot:UN04417